MADVQAPSEEAAPALTAGMLLPYQTLGPYTPLQEAAARLSRNPLGVIMDEAGQPLTVVTRDTLLALLGGGKDADHARGKMGARQQARERREGGANTRSLLSLRDDLPPLLTAAVGTPLAALAEQARAGGAVGVLGTQDGKPAGVLPSRTLLRRVPEAAPPPEATPTPPAPDGEAAPPTSQAAAGADQATTPRTQKARGG
jgi:hypothetical protein